MARIVDSCPRNLSETLIASSRLGCGQDKYGNNQYLCLPNSEKTGLVEFCHDGVMGMLERGYCLETTGDDLSETSCLHFLMGCPDREFHIIKMYRYPACLRISTGFQCYIADPSCRNVALNTTTEEAAETLVAQGVSTDHTLYNVTATIIHTTTLPEDTSAIIGTIVGSLVAVLVAILLLLTIIRVLQRRKRNHWRRRERNYGMERYAIDTQRLEDIVDRREDGDNDITSGHDPLLATEEEKQEDIPEAKITQGMQNQKRENTSASNFRKPKDNSLSSSQLNNFFSRGWQFGVGHLLCGDFAGTAFRIGDRYLLTAFHIIENTLDACLKMIIENAMCDPNRGNSYLNLLQVLEVRVTGSETEMIIENGIKEWITKCKEHIFISSLLEGMRATGFSVARENILKIIGENQMQVVFGRMKEQEEGFKYPVKYDIPFYNKAEDIAILEIDSTDLSCLPMAFALERSITPPESIHIVGYPASHGRSQIFDPKCPLILEMDARSTLAQWKVMFPGENFENFSRACDSAFSGKGKVLFHCSESTAHGASGSPGLILSNTDKPKVYLMLQEGFPSFVYGNNCQIDIKTVFKEHLIESGISMPRVYSLLSTKPYLVDLRNAIFHF